MAEKTDVEFNNPTAYIMTPVSPTDQEIKYSRQSKALFGYAISITTALIVVLILGGVYYYRTLEVLHETVKTYHDMDRSGETPVNRQIEIDTATNTVIFHLSGHGFEPGSLAVLDYPKSLTGIYDPTAKQCFLIAGIWSNLMDPQALSERLEKNLSKPSNIMKVNYQIADDYPVSDKSILPSSLKSPCAYLPVYWLESVQQHQGVRNARQVDSPNNPDHDGCVYACVGLSNGQIKCGWLC
jgi:hypothetical protein